MPQRGSTAIIAKRTDERPIEIAEMRALAASAGYNVAGELTQVRSRDPDTEFGAGKINELATRVTVTDADVVIVDNDLDPNRTFALQDRIGCDVIDRKRLVIDIFADRANTRRARLEVRLARLQYELPLAEERAKRGEANDRMGFKSRGEPPAERIRANYRRQIRALEAELEAIDAADNQRHTERHEAGFDLVALAGYTNAGKSTLLRRLAEDLTVDENEGRHADLDATAESRNQLFTTLDTTMRRAELGGHRLLVTDTVGFISGLPHWLVESFESTLAAAYDADAVCLIIDANEDDETMRKKTETSLSVVREHRDAGIVPVLNKSDIATGVPEKRRIIGELTDAEPVAVSALEGRNIDTLAQRLQVALPDRERTTVTVENSDDGMSFLSWIHDHARVEDVEYGEQIRITLSSRPEVVEQVKGRAQPL